jgi:hypothetical protein
MVSLLLSAVLLAPLEAPPGVRVQAEGDWPFAALEGETPRRVVIRSAAQLVHAHPREEDKAGKEPSERDEKIEAEMVAKALKVKEIDWKRHMLLVVHEGGIRNRRWLELSFEMKDKTLNVLVTSVLPGAETEPFKIPRRLSRVYLVDRFDDEVKFTHKIKAQK